MTSTQATIMRSSMVVMWGALALSTDMTAGIPPFQLVAMATPLITILLLVLFWDAETGLSVMLACAAIVAGALLASLEISAGRQA